MAVGVAHVFEVIDIHDDGTERTVRGRILAKDRKVTVEFPGVRNVQSRIKPGLPRIRTSRVDGLASEWRDLHQRCILYRGGHACPHEDAGDLAFPFQSRNRAKPFLFSADEYCGRAALQFVQLKSVRKAAVQCSYISAARRSSYTVNHS